MGYSNAYTAGEFSKNVLLLNNKLKGAEETLKTSLFNSSANLLHHHIRRLEQMQKKVFDALNVRDINELNDRLRKLEKVNVINFSGDNLAKIFTEAVKQKNAQERNLFDKNVREYLNSLEIPQEFIEHQSDKAIQQIIGVLNANLKTGQFGFGGSIKGKKEGYKLAGFNEKGYDPQRFSEPMIRRFKELMAEKGLWKFEDNNKKNKITDKIWIQNNSTEDVIQVIFNWNGDEYTKGYSPKDALTNLSEMEIKDINEKMIKGILNYANNDPLLKQILEYMVDKNNTVFFVGKNYQEISGVLGEATAVYYLHKLIGKDSFDSSIKWKGGIINGTKPHQDIILNEQFGIQVKNTTRQEVVDSLNLRNNFISFNSDGYKVNFQNASLPTILASARKSGLSFEASDIFESYFGMISFNVPYDWEEGQFRKVAIQSEKPWDTHIVGSNAVDVYGNAKKMLDAMEKDIQILIQLLATATMYMQLDNINTTDANILYMIGSSAIFSAVDILKDVEESLNKMQTSNFNIEFENKNNITIVDAINTGRKITDKRGKLKHYSKETYSDLTLSSIVISSSFTF